MADVDSSSNNNNAPGWERLGKAEERFFEILRAKEAYLEENSERLPSSGNYMLSAAMYRTVQQFDARQREAFVDIVSIVARHSHENPGLSAGDIEDRLRREDRGTHLVARPFSLSKLDDNVEVTIGGRKDCRYEAEFVVTRDPFWYAKHLSEFGSASAAQNREKLSDSGFLVTRDVGRAASSLKALYGADEEVTML